MRIVKHTIVMDPLNKLLKRLSPISHDAPWCEICSEGYLAADKMATESH